MFRVDIPSRHWGIWKSNKTPYWGLQLAGLVFWVPREHLIISESICRQSSREKKPDFNINWNAPGPLRLGAERDLGTYSMSLYDWMNVAASSLNCKKWRLCNYCYRVFVQSTIEFDKRSVKVKILFHFSARRLSCGFTHMRRHEWCWQELALLNVSPLTNQYTKLNNLININREVKKTVTSQTSILRLHIHF